VETALLRQTSKLRKPRLYNKLERNGLMIEKACSPKKGKRGVAGDFATWFGVQILPRLPKARQVFCELLAAATAMSFVL
jgi:hypothetical protein